MSGEGSQDRNDRAILTPWVKFLWESYRQCLDLLRNNNSVEKLYQDVAQMGECHLVAFQQLTSCPPVRLCPAKCSRVPRRLLRLVTLLLMKLTFQNDVVRLFDLRHLQILCWMCAATLIGFRVILRLLTSWVFVGICNSIITLVSITSV